MSTTDKSSNKSVNGVFEENSGIANGISGQAASETQVSPRVSTVGTDDPGHKKDHHAFFAPQVGNEYRDFTDPTLDSLHWAGVKKRGDFDQRSVASSMNAEKDDKSIYEEPAVGAVEEAEEDLDGDEEPEEIVLSGMGEPSASTVDIRGDSGAHIDHEDSFAHENTSPRGMETRIAASSVAVSDTDAASIRPVPSEDGDGELEDIALDKDTKNNNPTSDSIPVPPRGGSATTDGGGGGESIALGSSAAPSSAASPRSLGLPPSPLSRASADFENHDHQGGNSPAAVKDTHQGATPWGREAASTGNAGGHAGSGEQYKSSLMRKVTGTSSGGEDGEGALAAGGSVVSDINTEDLDASASMVATDGASGAPSLTGSVPRTITADVVAEEEDEEKEEKGREIEITDQMVAAVVEEKAEEEVVVSEVQQQFQAAKLEEGKQIEMPESTVVIEALEVENNKPSLAAAGTAIAASQPAPVVNLGAEWEETFKGLLYSDGVDALGRPVVVLNADAVPPRMKSAALTYVKAHLEPLVNSGHYVIVFTARKAKLPSFWIMGAYQTLPRPYRKNVQYVILVKPSGFLKAMLSFMKPFVSKKAGRKIKAVDTLEDIGESTGGEVTLHHLGEKFLNDDAMEAEAEAAIAAAQAGP
ncbi:hypothetical protein Ndes2437B_g02488 [Nannochloris sp. 'desiccata']|nr:hypothetical protein KSW81_001484 [Chlorella desiccata (nom. nud.)]